MPDIKKLCMGCMNENHEGTVCAVCGFDEETYKSEGTLPLRSILADRFVVGKVISVNGEGNSYLGYDKAEESIVTIREYFPQGIANRDSSGTIYAEKEKSFVFNDGLMKFIELYKKVATLKGSAFYKVIDIFETNGTAYSVSEYLPAITLKEFLIRNGGALKWEQVRPLLLPVIGALGELHSLNIVHGGISPETLMVGRDGKIRITGFAIPEIRTINENMTAQLYPGFAALEQYTSGNITPATDVYSFAATIFRTFTGTPPAEATARLENDTLSFSKTVAETLPRCVLVALANALKLRAEHRTASMEAFREDINSSEEKLSYENTVERKNQKEKSNMSTKRYTVIAAIVTGAILLVLGAILFISNLAKSEKPNDTPSLLLSSTVSVGDIGNSKKPDALFSVPDFTGMSYAEVTDNDEYNKWFVFSVVKKEYNDKVAKGKICGQSVAVGTSAKRDTKMELTISLGPKEVLLSNKLARMTKEEAYISLLELGFEPDNIEFIPKMGAEQTEKEIVIEALPAFGTKVSPDSYVILYYNSNIKEEETSSNTEDVSSTESSFETSED